MGETAKILNPEKTIFMPNLQADCSLDLLFRKNFVRFVNIIVIGRLWFMLIQARVLKLKLIDGYLEPRLT